MDPFRAPGGPDAFVRRALQTASTSHDLEGEGGARYLPGRVIVKFRDGVPAASRLSALSATSPTASISQRPDYANFDVVQIDPSEDPAAVARGFAQQPDVEYAQPAHRVHAQFVPNDPLYKKYQWNLPLIGMERAWDIQPQAGSSIIVAVIDTGVAYSNATLTATLPALGASACSTSATMIARCIPAGVLPDSTIFRTSASYRSGFNSLYFS